MTIKTETPQLPPPCVYATAIGCIALVIWSLTALVSYQLRTLPLCQLVTSVFITGFITTMVRLKISQGYKELEEIPWHGYVVGVFVLLGTQYGYMAAFKYAPPEQVDLIYYLWPVIVIIGAGLLPNERFSWKPVIGTLIGFCGVAMLVLHDSRLEATPATAWIGHSLALVSALCWASYTLYARLKRHASTSLLGLCCGPAAIISWILHYTTWETLMVPSLSQLGLLLFIGVAVLGISLSFWDHAVKKGHFQLLSSLAYFNPVLSVSLLVAFGKAQATPMLAIATLLVTLGSSVHQGE